MRVLSLRQRRIDIATLSGNHSTPLIHRAAIFERSGNIDIALAGQAQHFASQLDSYLDNIGGAAAGENLERLLDLERVANLPTKEQALAQLLGVIKAPIGKFVRTLAEPHAKLVRTIAAVKDQKQGASA